MRFVLMLATLLVAASPVLAQDSLRIAERVGTTLDAGERAYFSVLPRLPEAATVWMRAGVAGAELVVVRPGAPDSVLALTPDERAVLAWYLDDYEADAEALLRGHAPVPGRGVLARLVRYRPALRPDPTPARLRLRSGEVLSGWLLWTTDDHVVLAPAGVRYDWRRPEDVRVLDVHDVAWQDYRPDVPPVLGTAIAFGIGGVASVASTAAGENTAVSAAVQGANFAVLAFDVLRVRPVRDRLYLDGSVARWRTQRHRLRGNEVFWRGVVPPELRARLAALPSAGMLSERDTSAVRPSRRLRQTPQRWHAAVSTPRLLAPVERVGEVAYAVTNSSATASRPVSVRRAASAVAGELLYAPSPRWALGLTGSVDQPILRKQAVAERRLKGWEAYVLGEVYVLPLPERDAPLSRRLSVSLGGGVGTAQIASTWDSGYVAGTYPYYYEIAVRPEDDPNYRGTDRAKASSLAALGRLSVEWKITPHTSMRFVASRHHVPGTLAVEGQRYTYRVVTGFEGTLLQTPSYTARFSHTDVNLGLRLHF